MKLDSALRQSGHFLLMNVNWFSDDILQWSFEQRMSFYIRCGLEKMSSIYAILWWFDRATHQKSAKGLRSTDEVTTQKPLGLLRSNAILEFSQDVAVQNDPDSKVHWANMGPTWVLSTPDGPHVGPINLAIRGENEMLNSVVRAAFLSRHMAAIPIPDKTSYHQIWQSRDDVIKWKHFPRYCPFVWGIHRSPVNSSHKG